MDSLQMILASTEPTEASGLIWDEVVIARPDQSLASQWRFRHGGFRLAAATDR
jgi:hypothetical protein